MIFTVGQVGGSNDCDTWQKCSLRCKTFASWVRLGMCNLLPTDITILGEGHTWDFELLMRDTCESVRGSSAIDASGRMLSGRSTSRYSPGQTVPAPMAEWSKALSCPLAVIARRSLCPEKLG